MSGCRSEAVGLFQILGPATEKLITNSKACRLADIYDEQFS